LERLQIADADKNVFAQRQGRAGGVEQNVAARSGSNGDEEQTVARRSIREHCTICRSWQHTDAHEHSPDGCYAAVPEAFDKPICCRAATGGSYSRRG
jgi:hypothetical protein